MRVRKNKGAKARFLAGLVAVMALAIGPWSVLAQESTTAATPTTSTPAHFHLPSGAVGEYASCTYSSATSFSCTETYPIAGAMKWYCSLSNSSSSSTCKEYPLETKYSCKLTSSGNGEKYWDCYQVTVLPSPTPIPTPTPTPIPTPVITPTPVPTAAHTPTPAPHLSTPKPTLAATPTPSQSKSHVFALPSPSPRPPSSPASSLATDYLNSANVTGAVSSLTFTNQRGGITEAIGPVAGMRLGSALTVWPILVVVDILSVCGIGFVVRRRWLRNSD